MGSRGQLIYDTSIPKKETKGLVQQRRGSMLRETSGFVSERYHRWAMLLAVKGNDPTMSRQDIAVAYVAKSMV